MNLVNWTNGTPIHPEHLAFDQQAVRDALRALSLIWIPITSGAILTGAVASNPGSGWQVTEGWVLINGEVVYVPGGPCANPSGGFWVISESAAPAPIASVQMQDGSFASKARVRTATIVTSVPPGAPNCAGDVLSFADIIADLNTPLLRPVALADAELANFNTTTGRGQGRWANWALCDGQSHSVDATTRTTPNLRGRLMRGYDFTNPLYNTLGNSGAGIGGADTRELTQANIPKFDLNIPANAPNDVGSGNLVGGAAGGLDATVTVSFGSDNPDDVDIRNPYRVTVFACRIGTPIR